MRTTNFDTTSCCWTMKNSVNLTTNFGYSRRNCDKMMRRTVAKKTNCSNCFGYWMMKTKSFGCWTSLNCSTTRTNFGYSTKS